MTAPGGAMIRDGRGDAALAASRLRLLRLLAVTAVVLLLGVRVSLEAAPRLADRFAAGAGGAGDSPRQGGNAAPEWISSRSPSRGAQLLLAHLPVCPLNAVTGVACPSCGGTRALLSLAAGQPLRALLWNPLMTLVAVGLPLLGLVAVALPARAGRMADRAGALLRRPAGRALLLLALLAQAAFLNWRGL